MISSMDKAYSTRDVIVCISLHHHSDQRKPQSKRDKKGQAQMMSTIVPCVQCHVRLGSRTLPIASPILF